MPRNQTSSSSSGLIVVPAVQVEMRKEVPKLMKTWRRPAVSAGDRQSASDARRRFEASLPAAREVASSSLAHKATLQNGFSVHTPMVALALARIGASPEEVRAQAASSAQKMERYGFVPIEEAKDATVTITAETWTDLRNAQSRHEQAYRRFWGDRIAEIGALAAAREAMPHFAGAIHSRLHHGSIRLSYALDLESDDEVAAALAAWCVNYTPLPPHASPSATASDLWEAAAAIRDLSSSDTFPRRALNLPSYGTFLSDPSVLAQFQRVTPLSEPGNIASFALLVYELFLQKPSIYTLHMVTGLHAVLSLEEAGVLEGQAYEEALQTHWLSCASMLLCLRGPKFERARARRTPLRPWDEMVSHVIGTRGDHDIKFVDTCLFFARKFPDLAQTAQLAASTLKKK